MIFTLTFINIFASIHTLLLTYEKCSIKIATISVSKRLVFSCKVAVKSTVLEYWVLGAISPMLGWILNKMGRKNRSKHSSKVVWYGKAKLMLRVGGPSVFHLAHLDCTLVFHEKDGCIYRYHSYAYHQTAAFFYLNLNPQYNFRLISTAFLSPLWPIMGIVDFWIQPITYL